MVLDDRAGDLLTVRRQNFHYAHRAVIALGVVVNSVALEPVLAAPDHSQGDIFVLEESCQLLGRRLRFSKISQGSVIAHKLKIRIRGVGSQFNSFFQIRFPLQ